MTHYPFTSIENYAKAIKGLQRKFRYVGKNEDGYPIYDKNIHLPTIKFVGTTKLHGTNAAVVKDLGTGKVYTQSRRRIITPDADNCNFAAFINERIPYINILFKNCKFTRKDVAVIAYGEFAGRGIQRNVAISEIEKTFFVFAVKVVSYDGSTRWLDVVAEAPDARIDYLPNYFRYEIDIDLNNPQKSEDEINRVTDAIVEQCPVGAEFGITGHGEGVVWVPIIDDRISYGYSFKTKGDKHEGKAKPKKAKVKRAVPDDVMKFVDGAVEERFKQGIDYIFEIEKVEPEMRHLGIFLKWIANDILREESDVIEKMDEKQVKKAISIVAKKKYIEYVNQI